MSVHRRPTQKKGNRQQENGIKGGKAENREVGGPARRRFEYLFYLISVRLLPTLLYIFYRLVPSPYTFSYITNATCD